MNDLEQELLNKIIETNKIYSSVLKCAIKCLFFFAVIWWLSYMFTPYLTKNYIKNSDNIIIDGD